MKPPRDLLAALCAMGGAIANLAAAHDAYRRGELAKDVVGHWLATAVDTLGDAWEIYMWNYDATQESALLDGGSDQVSQLTDHIGLDLVTAALRDRMIVSGLGVLVQINQVGAEPVTAVLRDRMIANGLGPVMHTSSLDIGLRKASPDGARSIRPETIQ